MDLTEIEKKLSVTFGLTIFDYLYLFGKKAELPKDLSLGDKSKVLREYIETVNTFFKETEQPEIQVDEEKLEETFFEVMHNLYLFRYILGIKLFAEYEIVRIETWFETKMINSPKNDFLTSIPETFSFKIPNSLIIDVLGNYDEFATMTQEKETHAIKSYISSVAFGIQRSTFLYTLFRNYTIKEFVPRLLEKQILELCEKSMTKIGIFLSSKVYGFLNQKYTLVQAKNNVLNLISKQLNSNEYYSDLEKFKSEFIKMVKSELLTMKALDPDTAQIITEEFWLLFRNNFDSLVFFPNNYYVVDFRKADQDRKPEKPFTNVIDFYVLKNDGTQWDTPIETYAIEFTPNAKEKIFEVVTNGFVNPNYTLNNYLYLYT